MNYAKLQELKRQKYNYKYSVCQNFEVKGSKPYDVMKEKLMA